MSSKKIKSKTIARYLFILILAIIVLLSVPKALRVAGYALWLFTPFIISYLLSLLVNPMVDRLEKRFRLPRGICAVLVIVLTVGVIGGIIFGIIWKLIDELRNVYDDLPIIFENLKITWISISEFFAAFVKMLPEGIQNIFNNTSEQAIEWLTNAATNTEIVRSAGNVARKLPSIFVVAIVFILSLYFMITDAEKVSLTLKKPFSKNFIEKTERFRTEIKKYVGGYVKAQLTIMCISFAILLIGLSILDIKYAPVISLSVAMMDALPFFGSGAVLWPWAIVSFIMGNNLIGVGLIIIYLAVILMRQFIEPKIVSKNIGVHPIMTLMAMYIGFRIFSIGGMILGPLSLVFLVSLYRTGIFDELIMIIRKLFAKIGHEFNNIKKSLDNEEKNKDE